MKKDIINLIRKEIFDINLNDFGSYVRTPHDVVDNIFDIGDKAKQYLQDTSEIDVMKDYINYVQTLHNVADVIFDIDAEVKQYLQNKVSSGIDAIRQFFKPNDTDLQFGFSDGAKEIFDPFFSEESSLKVIDYIQSNEDCDINFIGICSLPNIDIDFGIIDLDIFNGIDLATSISDSSSFLDAIFDIGGEAVDISDATTTLGLSLIISWGVKKIFKNMHDEKTNEIHQLSMKISPKMKLLLCIKNNMDIEDAYPVYQLYFNK